MLSGVLCSVCRFTALHYAVQCKSTASVRAFSQLEGMSHLPDGNEGRTPLMLAAQDGSEQMVKVSVNICETG